MQFSMCSSNQMLKKKTFHGEMYLFEEPVFENVKRSYHGKE